MGLSKTFKTDSNLESKGIIIDYGDAKIRIARAGGANKRFAKRLEAITKPYRRAIQTETMDQELSQDLLRQVYAETIILDWETKTGEDDAGQPQYAVGIDPEDAGQVGEELLPVNADNIVAVFRNLPDLFSDLQEQAQKSALFREDIREADAGN